MSKPFAKSYSEESECLKKCFIELSVPDLEAVLFLCSELCRLLLAEF
jgi:hypothetical protein